MNDLITVRETCSALPVAVEQEVADLTAKIAECERQAKKVKEADSTLRERLLYLMEEHHILKLQSEEASITYIAPTDRESFDTKAFRADHADLYDEYIKMSPVKSSVKVKVK